MASVAKYSNRTCIRCGIKKPANRIYSKTVENAIYIDPDFRGMGFATKLLSALLPICKEIGLKQVIAVIGNSENHGSITLHKNFGFRKVGTMEKVGFKFDRWIDVVLMQKSL